jgi:hypothetical protein
MSGYVYRAMLRPTPEGEPRDVFEVGFFYRSGIFENESFHEDREAAAARVSYLNGGARPGMEARVDALEKVAHPPARNMVASPEFDALAARVAQLEEIVGALCALAGLRS